MQGSLVTWAVSIAWSPLSCDLEEQPATVHILVFDVSISGDDFNETCNTTTLNKRKSVYWEYLTKFVY